MAAGPSFLGLFCFLFTAMLFFGGCAAFAVLLCTGGGRRVLRGGALVMLAVIVGFLILRTYAYRRHERVVTEATQRAAEARTAELRAEAVLEEALRDRQQSLDEVATQLDPHPASVTLELCLHADRLHKVASSPAAIAAIVAKILATADGNGDHQQDLARVPLKDLLKLDVALDNEQRVALADIVQVGRRRVPGEYRPEDTIHVRLEGVEPQEVVRLLELSARLVERAVAAADDPLHSLVSVERDSDMQGFSIRVPARDVRRIAAQLMLPAALDRQAETLRDELAAVAPSEPVAAETTAETVTAKPAEEQDTEATAAVAENAHEQAEAAHDVDLTVGASLDDSSPRAATDAHRQRPDWVDAGEVRLPNGIFRMTSAAGPFSSTEECFQTVPSMTRGIVARYVGRFLGNEAASRLDVPPSFVESVLLKDQWIGEIESETLGTTMYEIHVLVEFDDAARRQLERMWHEQRLEQRLTLTVAASGLVLLLLGTTFGYLKLDTATRGFYSGRLKLAAGAIFAAAATTLASVLGLLLASVLGRL